MLYKADGKEISVGDRVLVEGGLHGTVICDFDKWEALRGYESWLTKEDLVGGGTLKSGVMIKTTELGFLHYPEEDDDIFFEMASVGSDPR